jgi:hypothetical protein
MALEYGTTGIKQKDWDVYVAQNGDSHASAMTTYKSIQDKTNLDALMTAMSGVTNGGRLGECRADSIDLGLDKGDTVDGNNLGEIVLNKACTFAAELINATPANIAALEDIDGLACDVLLVEVDTHDVSGSPYKTAVLLENLVVNYAEKITGGDSIRSTVSISRNVGSPSSFRIIDDIDYT